MQSCICLLSSDPLLLLQLGEAFVEDVDREVDVGLRNAHGRLDAEDVAVVPAAAEQKPHVFGHLEDLEQFLLGRRLLRVADELHACATLQTNAERLAEHSPKSTGGSSSSRR